MYSNCYVDNSEMYFARSFRIHIVLILSQPQNNSMICSRNLVAILIKLSTSLISGVSFANCT